MKCYDLIKWYYGNTCAKRSKVPYIKHIDEGLKILDQIGASEITKEAYCLHPIFQNDFDFSFNYPLIKDKNISADIIALVIEYRSVANEYLSTKIISSYNDIRLSPIKEVNQMLFADKMQNFSDFLMYHYGVHERSDELFIYFGNWLKRLRGNII